MIEADHLLEVAKLLAEAPRRGAPRQVRLRRSISSAYYALFHRLVTVASDLLAGKNPRGSLRYRAIYRSFEHKHMAETFRKASSGNLKSEAGHPFHPTLRQCANSFVELQLNRHDADYDPAARFTLSEAWAAIAKAEDAINKLNAAPGAERDLQMTLMHVKLRS